MGVAQPNNAGHVSCRPWPVYSLPRISRFPKGTRINTSVSALASLMCSGCCRVMSPSHHILEQTHRSTGYLILNSCELVRNVFLLPLYGVWPGGDLASCTSRVVGTDTIRGLGAQLVSQCAVSFCRVVSAREFWIHTCCRAPRKEPPRPLHVTPVNRNLQTRVTRLHGTGGPFSSCLARHHHERGLVISWRRGRGEFQ